MSLPKALAEKEAHPVVAKAIAGLAKKYSPKKMQPLFEAVTVGWLFVGLGRKADARAFMDEVADPIAFTGNFNVWTPVANALCLSARLTTSAARKKALIDRIVAAPALAVMDQARFAEWLARDRAGLTEAVQGGKPLAIARALQGVAYFEQTAEHGFFYDGWVDGPALTAQIDAALEELARRLA